MRGKWRKTEGERRELGEGLCERERERERESAMASLHDLSCMGGATGYLGGSNEPLTSNIYIYIYYTKYFF